MINSVRNVLNYSYHKSKNVNSLSLIFEGEQTPISCPLGFMALLYIYFCKVL